MLQKKKKGNSYENLKKDWLKPVLIISQSTFYNELWRIKFANEKFEFGKKYVLFSDSACMHHSQNFKRLRFSIRFSRIS